MEISTFNCTSVLVREGNILSYLLSIFLALSNPLLVAFPHYREQKNSAYFHVSK